MDRWPYLKKDKPCSLVNYKPQANSKGNVYSYFNNLKSVLVKNNLMENPEHNYINNVDERCVKIEHSPPYIICGTQIPVLSYFVFK